MDEWPMTASPVAPPLAVIYFGREIGGSVQDVCALPLREVWQVGTYIKELDMEDVMLEDEGRVVHYYRVVQRDEEGATVKRHGMKMWFVGTTWDECLKKAKDVKLPFNVYQMMCLQSGKPAQSYFRWAGIKKETSSVAEALLDDERATPGEKSSRRTRIAPGSLERAPRRAAGGDDHWVTLGQLCDEHKVDAGDVRGVLRKRGVEKPGGGWTWEKEDTRLAQIVDVIKAVKRGERK